MSLFEFKIIQDSNETQYVLGPKPWKHQIIFLMIGASLFLAIFGTIIVFHRFSQHEWPGLQTYAPLMLMPIGISIILPALRLRSRTLRIGGNVVSIVRQDFGFIRQKTICRVEEVAAVAYMNGTLVKRNWIGLRKRGESDEVMFTTGLASRGEYERIAKIVAEQLNVVVEEKK